ncbi:MAG: tRNA (cytidine(56)-2'-O)-methyltransferase [Candidatus Aenigmarchaeota archaeon]|nr:tRNA (cytidine(56)-2'-O)-methyltransferase [Candidatus Aenigmarchaeota archaeon]
MITVLRLGHRPGRDARISTHVGLVARAFGADAVTYSGLRDAKMMDSVRKVTERSKMPFDVSYEKNWKKFVESFDGTKVHLTMYGEPFEGKIKELKTKNNILVIVGGEKVPGEIYGLATNLSVTNEPHSEVAALAVFLWELNN